MYLTHLRPDIAYFVRVISRFMHNQTKHHLGVAKRIMRYVAGTINLEYGMVRPQTSGCMDLLIVTG